LAPVAVQPPVEYTIGTSSLTGGGGAASIGAAVAGTMSSDLYTIESGFMAYANQVATAGREGGETTQEFIAGQTTDRKPSVSRREIERIILYVIGSALLILRRPCY
jgi:hypothetical protein